MSVEKVKPIEAIGKVNFSTEAGNRENKRSFKDTIKQIEENMKNEEKVEQQLKGNESDKNIQQTQKEMILNNRSAIYNLMCKLETVGEVGAINYISDIINKDNTKDEER